MLRFALYLTAVAVPLAADAQWVPMPSVDCYCTDSTGDRVEIGERTCLKVGQRQFMGFCEMAQNVPIWRDTGEDCITS